VKKLTLSDKHVKLRRRCRRSGSSCRLLTLHASHNALNTVEGRGRLALSLLVDIGHTKTLASSVGACKRCQVRAHVPGRLRWWLTPVEVPFSPCVSFLVVDQCTVEAGGLVATIARPIIVPLGVVTLRLVVGRPVKGRHRCGLNLDGSDIFLCVRCGMSRDRDPRPSSTLGQFPTKLDFHALF
jgi:hypothetical protein